MKKVMSFTVAMGLLLALVGCRSFNIGATKENREQLLNESIVPENNWNIATETEIEGYLISAIYASNNKSGLAVFEAGKNDGYKLQRSMTVDTDQVIYTHEFLNNNHYDVIWFNGAQTEYAEVIYTINGQQQEAIRFDTRDMGIIVNPSPAKDYSIDVIYYDADGNTY